MRKEHYNIATNIDLYWTNIVENTAIRGANANTFPLVWSKIEMVLESNSKGDLS